MTTKKKATKKSKLPVAGLAAGVLAVTAAAGATYYFYGAKKAKSHRQAAAKWAHDMKRDVIREAKKLEKLDEKIVSEIVDRTAKVYRGVQSVDPKAVAAAASELKDNWQNLQRELRSAKKTVKSTATKAVKARKAVKKSVKKAVKKRA